MKKYKPLFDRLIVFSIPVRHKIEGSILYSGNPKRSSFNRAEEVWILEAGRECKEDFTRGSHAWINDSFELEPTELDLWQYHEHEPDFKELRSFALSVDGRVLTSLIKEGAILAIDDNYEVKTVVKSMPKD